MKEIWPELQAKHSVARLLFLIKQKKMVPYCRRGFVICFSAHKHNFACDCDKSDHHIIRLAFIFIWKY